MRKAKQPRPKLSACALRTDRRRLRLRNELARLSSGIQTFQVVRFDLRGILQLNGSAMIKLKGKSYLQRVQGIQIGRKCAIPSPALHRSC